MIRSNNYCISSSSYKTRLESHHLLYNNGNCVAVAK